MLSCRLNIFPKYIFQLSIKVLKSKNFNSCIKEKIAIVVKIN